MKYRGMQLEMHVGMYCMQGSRVKLDHRAAPCLQQHRFSYNEPMPIESTTQSLCDLALRFGEDSDEGGGMVGRGARSRGAESADLCLGRPG